MQIRVTKIAPSFEEGFLDVVQWVTISYKNGGGKLTITIITLHRVDRRFHATREIIPPLDLEAVQDLGHLLGLHHDLFRHLVRTAIMMK